ncbi:murein transglycosylase A [Thalassovita mediterranea]|jgi:membrane-bound lytic murein transglycosylase A|uniref:peptidoglycan lytic exotransglycosylase n=1 Tax=Thalassovita mediterranea TaxID=340021 RepID=A0A0P1GRS8_9RHOB|nr:murein transglycosylase A [Thalassovita mediterranea]MCG7572705.1 murein transglycosylase A [Phaeobacter sp. CNT1-3]CUH85462.1 Membrane-bound lytic murein transglycosylase A precursor [Thalassovita mediterranea]SIS31722.1 membrane-bound lytic murein transglycosylase A [Thalassovita mediterranea]
MIKRLAAASLAGLLAASSAQAELSYKILNFQDLDGWAKDDHASALATFRNTCMDMDQPDYAALCALADTIENPRAFFELFFRPVLIEEAGKDAMFTGYFEPELDGSLTQTSRYRYPVYAKPREAQGQWLTREQIETGPTMKGRGLEIAWVDDPVELFFLQIQGSGRIRLPSGAHIRVGYGGNNGHNYRSVGQELIRRGVYQPHQVSAQVIQNWVRRNPVDGAALLRTNPSYVFFRKVTRVSPEQGPLGAMNRSITALRSIAVDPRYTPLGAPVWVEKDGEGPMRRLMIAQDTGSAIKGAQRADIFFGTGDVAGKAAGRLRDPGRMYVLMPIQRAYAALPEEDAL